VKFIMGFNRDRDGYQVPGALAEADQLDLLVTDYYHGRSRPPLKRLAHRQSPLIPGALVKPVLGSLAPQILHEVAKRFRMRTSFPARQIDDRIAGVLLRESTRRPDDGLFIYSNYAWQAFQRALTPTRLLFQYHPNNRVIDEAMSADELGSSRAWERELEQVDPGRKRKEELEIEFATGVVCASAFTARGLILAGVPTSQIQVVGYGCPPPPAVVRMERERSFLFVGQGVQRKGLHLLAAAWRELRPIGWRLRVVASRMDPEIARMLDDVPGVELTGAVSAAELRGLYDSSSALVLPSLVEGFGLVLGEALSRGCALIATTNTGLPDLDLPEPVARVIRPGEVAVLVDSMQRHVAAFERGEIDPAANSAMAEHRSWGAFRTGIRQAVTTLS
jgi:glycosyltransferase involved in cell wall biosynthesis